MTVSSTDAAENISTDLENHDVPAESSPAPDGVKGIMDVVNTTLGEAPEEAPTSMEQGSEEPAPENPADDQQPAEENELSEEELAKLSERTQKRFRELVELRRAAEGKVQEVQMELEALRPKAQRMDELLGYMHTNGIEPEHLNNALGIVSMINKGDYQSALPVLENLVQQIRHAAGEILPPDLQREVQLGYITEARAKELHKARLSEHRAREMAQMQAQQVAEERHRQQMQALVNSAASAADEWSREQAKSDPDWNLKQDRITEKVELELHRRLQMGPENYPRTREEVRALLDQCRKQVEDEIRRYAPAPRPSKPFPTGGSASPHSAAKPKSLMDAVNMALGAE